MWCSVHGSLIASLLREASDDDVREGLLFGTCATLSGSHATDVNELTTTLQEECALCSYVVTGRRLSFYDSEGMLSHPAVSEARAKRENQAVVGWFKVKTNSILTPSIREAAVHRELARASDLRGDSNPLVFLSLATNLNSAECTQTMDVQCFLQPDGKLALQPSPLHLSNLTHDSAAEHSAFRSASHRGNFW